ncbi:MAG: hypothetical protein ACRD2R_08870 [Terriglobales bacterium]
MLVLDENAVRRLLEPAAAVAAIEAAFRRDWLATARMPPRTHLDLPGGGVLLTMPCSDSVLDAADVKVVTVAGADAPPGERVQAIYCLLDSAGGRPLAFLAANWLTDLRTAAVSAVATKFLARADAPVLDDACDLRRGERRENVVHA